MNNYIRKVTINMETIDEDWPLVEALKQGKTIQYFAAGVWRNYGFETQSNEIDFNLRTQPRRIKPTPTIRPWKPEKVPLGAVIRPKGEPQHLTLLFSVSPNGIQLPDSDSLKMEERNFKYFLDWSEHSLDHGKTWLPCGVKENV